MTGAASVSDQQLAEYFDLLSRQVKAAHESLQHSDRWALQPGSSLVGDDRGSDPYQVSHFVRSELGVAVDHLLGTIHLVELAEVLHPLAPFTLIRSSLEAAAGAIWVLQPTARAERVTRRLRLAVVDIRDGAQAADGAGVPLPKSEADRIAQVQQITRAAHGDSKIVAARPPSTTSIVTAANDGSGSAFDALLAWRICSGVAHGRTWARLSFLPREPIATHATNGVTEFEITSDMGRLVWALGSAVDLVNVAIGMYAQRA